MTAKESGPAYALGHADAERSQYGCKRRCGSPKRLCPWVALVGAWSFRQG